MEPNRELHGARMEPNLKKLSDILTNAFDFLFYQDLITFLRLYMMRLATHVNFYGLRELLSSIN